VSGPRRQQGVHDTLLRNATIVPGPASATPFVGDLAIDDGRIALVRPASDAAARLAAVEVIDATDHIVLPGFVNAHLHAVPSLMRTAFAAIRIDDHGASPLVAALYEQLLGDPEAVELGARLCLAEALMAGATSVGVMEYLDPAVAARVAAELGLRGAMSVYPDPEDPSWVETLEFVAELGFTPMLLGPNEDDPAFTEPFLHELRRLAEHHGVRVHMHVSETARRHAAVVERYGVSPVEQLERLGLLPHLYAVHCTVLSDRDVELLAAHDVPVVITPVSESLLSDGVTPLAQLREAGVTVALATDGGPWAGGEDMLGEMKATALLNRAHDRPAALTGADAIEMATVNGARVLGEGARRGTLEVGKDADLVVLDARRAHLQPLLHDGVLANVRDVVAFAAGAADVARVIVGGRTVHLRGEAEALSPSQVAAIRAAGERVWRRAGGPQATAWLPLARVS
jgi:5-methylthioadenosine/S-adenosylhomocysteine deaminase